MNDFSDAQFEHKPSGYILIGDKEVAHTKQCCHCNAHFVSIKGSGKVRGYCVLCNQITCGSPACDLHVPFEAKLEYTETGKIYQKFMTQTIMLLDKYGNQLL